MNEIWANRLIAGTQTWDKVPEARKEAVRAILEKRLNDGKEFDLEAIIGA